MTENLGNARADGRDEISVADMKSADIENNGIAADDIAADDIADSDIASDPFGEYVRQTEPQRKRLAYSWYTAIGLQAADGLTASEYLKKTARNNIEGKITLREAGKLIETYYEHKTAKTADRTAEADIVSAHIASILSDNSFTFAVPQLLRIHKSLFNGVYSHAGKIRNYNISKKEWILNGESVIYGNAADISAMLEYDFRAEKEFDYPQNSIVGIIPHLAGFIARLWQIHPFEEGSTRAAAVFFIKYLRTMGFSVTNDIFARNAWYFRNSLVRANYNDLSNGIRETTEYLELFLRNLLLNENNELKNRNLHI